MLERHGSLDAPELGPFLDAARRAVRGRASGRDRCMSRVVTGGRLGGRKLLSPAGEVARRPPDLRPRPRDAVLGPRRRLRPERARPVLRHRARWRSRRSRAARTRPCWSTAHRRWRVATPRRSGSPTAARSCARTRSATSSAPRSGSASSSATRRINSPTRLGPQLVETSAAASRPIFTARRRELRAPTARDRAARSSSSSTSGGSARR